MHPPNVNSAQITDTKVFLSGPSDQLLETMAEINLASQVTSSRFLSFNWNYGVPLWVDCLRGLRADVIQPVRLMYQLWAPNQLPYWNLNIHYILRTGDYLKQKVGLSWLSEQCANKGFFNLCILRSYFTGTESTTPNSVSWLATHV